MEVADIREKAHRVCADYVGGVWKSLKPDDIIIEKIHSGFINYLFKLSLPSDFQPINNEPKKILMRNFSDNLKAGQFAVMAENILVILLSGRQLCPKVYGVFDGGRLDEFIESRNLKSMDFSDPNILENVVRNLAKLHCLQVPLNKDPSYIIQKHEALFLPSLLINTIPEEMKNNPAQIKLFKRYCSLKPQEEYEWLKKIRDASNSPIVLCHNDFHLSNLLLCNSTDGTLGNRVIFIDYELSGYNYRGNDLSRMMGNFCFDVLPEPPYFTLDWERYPTVEKQKDIFKIYLSEIQRQTNNSKIVDDEEVQLLVEEIKIFHLITLFIGLVHTIRIPFELTKKLDMTVFADVLFDTYLNKKADFLKSNEK